MRRKFLANPAAAGGKLSRRLPSLVISLEARFGPVDLEMGSSWEDLKNRAQKAATDGFDQVVALGGDGTVNAVANGLVGSKATLAVAPLGTGSDYFRGYAGEVPWMEILAHGIRQSVDAVELTHAGGRRIFLNMASAGLSADVVRRRESMPPQLPSVIAYGLPALCAVFALRGQRVQLEIDGETFEENLVAVFFSKGTFAGGGMRIGAAAKLDDGKIAVTAVRNYGTWRSLPKFPRLYTGRFDDPMFLTRRATSVKLRTETPWPVECDGELVGAAPFEARILPGALRVLVPQKK